MPLVTQHWQPIVEELSRLYPDAKCELDFTSPFQLLIATILSAQCTDERVNKVTPTLFEKYNAPFDLLKVAPESLEADIVSCGLFRNKAKNILAACRMMCEHYGGVVPPSLEELAKLPGVGRKTASVVAYNAFGIPAMAVDTHVFRVSRRLGLAAGRTPEKVEQELCSLLPKNLWGHTHHLLIWHGRRVCYARKPECSGCTISVYCPTAHSQ